LTTNGQAPLQFTHQHWQIFNVVTAATFAAGLRSCNLSHFVRL